MSITIPAVDDHIKLGSSTEEDELPIIYIPEQIDMGQILPQTEAQNILTIGTDGKTKIKIVSVELKYVPEGFEYDNTECRDKELSGSATCSVIMSWHPTDPINFESNLEVVWHVVGVSANIYDNIPVFGVATDKDDKGASEGSAMQGRRLKPAVGPDGNVIGTISDDGMVRNADGNIIGRVDINGMVIDDEANVIGVAGTGKLIYNVDDNVIGYIDERGIAYDDENNIIGKMTDDGVVVDDKGAIIGKAVDYGYVSDNAGNIIASILPDGSAADLDGNIIGKMDKNSKVIDFSGNIIGYVAKAGKVMTDADNNRLGVVLSNGDIVDEDGNIVGHVNPDGSVKTNKHNGIPKAKLSDV